ncbi:hypothetical protein KAF25_005366 [Fusarium avenaceum]|uniref:Uncharacterized protein n=1 Tax=Fusarium avenaceum TaxID=40199 RepID=A0A9P7KTI8_9HYPO|nr:hypothetical protein KAF25_005366 [Fusarium avenaceum]
MPCPGDRRRQRRPEDDYPPSPPLPSWPAAYIHLISAPPLLPPPVNLLDPSKLARVPARVPVRSPVPLGPAPTSAAAPMATSIAFAVGELAHQDVSRAMQDAARKYHRRSRILEDKYRQRPSPGEYERMAHTLNQMKFIPPLDSGNTKANLYYIRRKFERYSLEVRKQQWQTAIRPGLCDKGFIQAFPHWICC